MLNNHSYSTIQKAPRGRCRFVTSWYIIVIFSKAKNTLSDVSCHGKRPRTAPIPQWIETPSLKGRNESSSLSGGTCSFTVSIPPSGTRTLDQEGDKVNQTGKQGFDTVPPSSRLSMASPMSA